MVELNGKSVPNMLVSFAAPIASAREVNAQEESIGPAEVSHGDLIASLHRISLAPLLCASRHRELCLLDRVRMLSGCATIMPLPATMIRRSKMAASTARETRCLPRCFG
jgi:hypothetical protein